MHGFNKIALGNRKKAQRLYAVKFTNRRFSNNQTFSDVHIRLMETGKIKKYIQIVRDQFVIFSLKNLFYNGLKKTQRQIVDK